MAEENEIVISNITEIFELFEARLTEGAASFKQSDKIAVERLTTLTGYALKNVRGAYGIIYTGAQYNDKEEKNRIVQLKHDILMSVVSIIRFIDNGLSIEKAKRYGMMPAEYADKAVEILSGIPIFSHRAAYDRKIVPLKTELVDEADGVWRYMTTFRVPCEFTEVNFR